jgi:hypothetical protein
MTSVSSVIYGLIALFGAALLLWRKLPVWCVVLILPALTLLGDKFQL